MPEHAEQYTIRRKVLVMLGASFHIYDAEGKIVGFCRQKAFKLKEDIRIFADEAMATPLLTIKARSIIDFGASYDVTLPDGQSVGSLRRRGLRSMFRDSWLVFDQGGRQVAMIQEDSALMATLRRLNDIVSLVAPQKYNVIATNGDAAGPTIAVLRQHFNPFVYRLGVAIMQEHEHLDDMLILGAGCLIAAVEGRQG